MLILDDPCRSTSINRDMFADNGEADKWMINISLIFTPSMALTLSHLIFHLLPFAQSKATSRAFNPVFKCQTHDIHRVSQVSRVALSRGTARHAHVDTKLQTGRSAATMVWFAANPKTYVSQSLGRHAPLPTFQVGGLSACSYSFRIGSNIFAAKSPWNLGSHTVQHVGLTGGVCPSSSCIHDNMQRC